MLYLICRANRHRAERRAMAAKTRADRIAIATATLPLSPTYICYVLVVHIPLSTRSTRRKPLSHAAAVGTVAGASSISAAGNTWQQNGGITRFGR